MNLHHAIDQPLAVEEGDAGPAGQQLVDRVDGVAHGRPVAVDVEEGTNAGERRLHEDLVGGLQAVHHAAASSDDHTNVGSGHENLPRGVLCKVEKEQG